MLFIEGSMEFQISSQLVYIAPADSIDRNSLSYSVATFCLTVSTLLLPCLLIYIIAQPFTKLKEEKFKRVWGALYDEIKIKDSKAPLFNNLVFIVRRILYIQIGFSLVNLGGVQIICMMLLNLLNFVYLGNIEPYKLRRKNKIELFNETCVALIGLHLPCFTDWLPDENLQYFVGYSLISFVLLLIFVNMCFVSTELARVIKMLVLNQMKKTKTNIKRQKSQSEENRVEE